MSLISIRWGHEIDLPSISLHIIIFAECLGFCQFGHVWETLEGPQSQQVCLQGWIQDFGKGEVRVTVKY